MATALGLETVFSTGVEATYGTPVVTDRFYEIVSESLRRNQTVIQSNGIRAGSSGKLRRGSRRALTQRWGEGDVVMEVATKGMGRWFQSMLGGTSTIVQQGVTTAYLQTHSLGSLGGRSLTIQKGLRDSTGTEVESFTFHGCKVTSWELAIGVGEILRLTTSIDAEDVDTATALAAPSYTTANVFHYAQGTLRVGGTTVANVSDASVSGENSLRTDAFFLGTGGLKGEPGVNDFRGVTGSLTAEFQSAATFYDRYAADTPAELVLEFVGAAIGASGFNERLTIRVPEVHFTGEPPAVDGPGVINESVDFEGADDGTNPGVTIEYMSSDTAI